MRKILVVATLLFPLLALAEDLRVASHYLNNPEKYVGQKITLTCAYVTKNSSTSSHRSYSNGQSEPTENKVSGMVSFSAYTVSKTTYLDSASINVQVPDSEVEKFLRKYGTNPRWDAGGGNSTRPMTGIFKKGEASYYLEYTPNS